jgi:hypothetical protein
MKKVSKRKFDALLKRVLRAKPVPSGKIKARGKTEAGTPLFSGERFVS